MDLSEGSLSLLNINSGLVIERVREDGSKMDSAAPADKSRGLCMVLEVCVVCGDRASGTTPKATRNYKILNFAFYRSSLWSHQLRGLQGFFQTLDPKATGLPVPRQQELRGDKAPPQSVSVLPAAKVPSNGHEK